MNVIEESRKLSLAKIERDRLADRGKFGRLDAGCYQRPRLSVFGHIKRFFKAILFSRWE